jgi:AraC-like DNA-binding protein
MPKVNLIEVAPPLALAEYVEAFWYCHIAQAGTIRLLPTACSELMAYRRWNGFGLSFIGPMGASQMAHVQPGDIYVGARLRAGTCTTFQEQSYQSLKNSKLHDYDIANPIIKSFEANFQNLHSAAEIQAHLVILVAALVEQKLLARDPLVDQFITLAESSSGNISTETAIAKLPISTRQFRRRFRQYTGFSPKELLRMYRQRAAIVDLKTMNSTVTELAANHGYTDHAHFSHEFRELIGVTPIMFDEELTLK